LSQWDVLYFVMKQAGQFVGFGWWIVSHLVNHITDSDEGTGV